MGSGFSRSRCRKRKYTFVKKAKGIHQGKSQEKGKSPSNDGLALSSTTIKSCAERSVSNNNGASQFDHNGHRNDGIVKNNNSGRQNNGVNHLEESKMVPDSFLSGDLAAEVNNINSQRLQSLYNDQQCLNNSESADTELEISYKLKTESSQSSISFVNGTQCSFGNGSKQEKTPDLKRQNTNILACSNTDNSYAKVHCGDKTNHNVTSMNEIPVILQKGPCEDSGDNLEYLENYEVLVKGKLKEPKVDTDIKITKNNVRRSKPFDETTFTDIKLPMKNQRTSNATSNSDSDSDDEWPETDSLDVTDNIQGRKRKGHWKSMINDSNKDIATFVSQEEDAVYNDVIGSFGSVKCCSRADHKQKGLVYAKFNFSDTPYLSETSTDVNVTNVSDKTSKDGNTGEALSSSEQETSKHTVVYSAAIPKHERSPKHAADKDEIMESLPPITERNKLKKTPTKNKILESDNKHNLSQSDNIGNLYVPSPGAVTNDAEQSSYTDDNEVQNYIDTDDQCPSYNAPPLPHKPIHLRAKTGRMKNEKTRFKHRATISAMPPPLPPRHAKDNEVESIPGTTVRRSDNRLSLELPLSPARPTPHLRPVNGIKKNILLDKESGAVGSNPDDKKANDQVDVRSTSSSVSQYTHILRQKNNSSAKKQSQSKSSTDSLPELPIRARQKGKEGPFKSQYLRRTIIEGCLGNQPKMPQNRRCTLPARAAYTKSADEEDNFMCLLDVPLRSNGAVMTPEKLTEKHRHDLLTAAEAGRSDYVRTLLNRSNIDVNVTDEDGWTPLHHACKSGNPDTVSLLIDRGACINKKTNYGSEPLMIALLEKHKRDTMRMWHQRDVAQVVHSLISAGADINMVDGNGLNTLLVAISVENNYTVDYLLDNGASVNAPLHLRSVLHAVTLQVSRGILWIELERKVLEYGANPNHKDSYNQVPASLLFYSEFEAFDASDIVSSNNSEVTTPDEEQHRLPWEKYMELPLVLRLAKPNLNTFGYTRKRLSRLLRHLRAGLDLANMPTELMLQLDKFLIREQNADVLRLFHACGHYPDVAKLQSYVPTQIEEFEELWDFLGNPNTLMQMAASTIRANTRPSAYFHASFLPIPKVLVKYITLDIYDKVWTKN